MKTATTSMSVRSLAAVGILAIAFGAFVAVPAFTHAQSSTISTQIGVGASGSDVTTLQTFLSKYPEIYPSGLVTGYYGSLTASAVSRFQGNNGLAQVGRVGPQTLALINSMILGGGSGNVGGVDTSAPQMSSIQVQPSNASATLSWTTGENSRAKIFYSASPVVALETTANFAEPTISGSVIQDNGYSTSHSLSIPGLSSHTTYYYMIESIDAAGNVMVAPYPAGFFTTI